MREADRIVAPHFLFFLSSYSSKQTMLIVSLNDTYVTRSSQEIGLGTFLKFFVAIVLNTIQED